MKKANMLPGKYYVCPSCGSRRLKALTKRDSYYCKKCNIKFLIGEEPMEFCFKCARPIIDPFAESELMGNGKRRSAICGRTSRMSTIID
jgi:DNA-directed RNA polymerase subunit RPC12/RpoP